MLVDLGSHERGLYFKLLTNFAMMGGVVTLLGSAIPEVIRSYHWSYTEAGAVFAASSVGFFVSSLGAGLLVESAGTRPVLISALAAQVVSLMFFAQTPSIPLNIALNFVIGVGLGTNELVTNYTVVRLEPPGKSRLMNLMHAAWCIGAILGPIGVANLLASKLAWQTVFRLVGVLIAVMALLLARSRFPVTNPGHLANRAELSPKPTLRSRLRGPGAIVLLSAITIFVYIGVEKGIYNWVAEYFVRVLKTSAPLGSAMVAVYWTGQLAGRFGLSVAYKGTRLEIVLLVLAAVSTAVIGLLIGLKVVWLAVVCTFLAGASNSGIFPVIISLTGKYSARGRAVGLVTAAGGVAGVAFPFLVAAVSDLAGFHAGFSTVLGLSVILVALTGAVAGRARRLA